MKGKTFRELNIGRITGLSAYELAVIHGYEGTEEEYVNKENATYINMIEYGNALKEELKDYKNLENLVNNRANDLGVVDSLDSIFDKYSTNPLFHMNSTGTFSYVCISDGSMCNGMETRTEGVQLKMSWLAGVQFRIKRDGEWKDWTSIVSSNPTNV